MSNFNKDRELLPKEIDTKNRLSNISLPSLNLNAIAVATNIYRSAQGLKLKMEREVLGQYGLSWTAFSLLYDLWISGSMETKKLSQSLGVTKATVSNITNTLERKEFVTRKVDHHDRRNVFITITQAGIEAMEELYPKFHQGEIDLVSHLSIDEQALLATLLRRIIRSNNF
ncbi:MarR family transcriptional regulator [Bacillus sp. FJAT-49705]|uniref:MarR family transcriptional regulator n=1 Tax=Cytobacillus citreus TaxID=2833586 RepID=A0ABS5NXB6_9BACI|nr:MarR family transcriptional regulator [Cytobacillus citreus]MBS4192008.1 MarR family transcriptional regulator [Cytobacillus citreus]